MEIGALVLLGFVVAYLWGRSREKQQQERRELRWFGYRDRACEDLGLDWNFDFAEMKLTIDPYNYSGPDDSKPTHYHLRRKDGGTWQIKHTDESLIAEIDELRADLASEMCFMRDEKRKKLEKLSKGAKWHALRSDIAAKVEPQYQRYVLHYREN